IKDVKVPRVDYQTTVATFVKGRLNHDWLGLRSRQSEYSVLTGTPASPLDFNSIGYQHDVDKNPSDNPHRVGSLAMEMSAIAGRNAALLAFNDWTGKAAELTDPAAEDNRSLRINSQSSIMSRNRTPLPPQLLAPQWLSNSSSGPGCSTCSSDESIPRRPLSISPIQTEPVQQQQQQQQQKQSSTPKATTATAISATAYVFYQHPAGMGGTTATAAYPCVVMPPMRFRHAGAASDYPSYEYNGGGNGLRSVLRFLLLLLRWLLTEEPKCSSSSSSNRRLGRNELSNSNRQATAANLPATGEASRRQGLAASAPANCVDKPTAAGSDTRRRCTVCCSGRRSNSATFKDQLKATAYLTRMRARQEGRGHFNVGFAVAAAAASRPPTIRVDANVKGQHDGMWAPARRRERRWLHLRFFGATAPTAGWESLARLSGTNPVGTADAVEAAAVSEPGPLLAIQEAESAPADGEDASTPEKAAPYPLYSLPQLPQPQRAAAATASQTNATSSACCSEICCNRDDTSASIGDAAALYRPTYLTLDTKTT
uniref:Prenylcys_lyase domain-containing protein n=1 Tax=Macrostomum lignano TaxID=282301 RepID=A0A1I8FM28_9PLAT